MKTLFKHELQTGPQGFVNLDRLIKSDIWESGVEEGIAVVYSPHTTGGITINENADPDVVRDMLYGLEKVYPKEDANYRHFEGNSHAHLKTSAVNPSQTLIIQNGKPVMGTWQSVYFCEFDGPRHRTVYVKVIAG